MLTFLTDLSECTEGHRMSDVDEYGRALADRGRALIDNALATNKQQVV